MSDTTTGTADPLYNLLLLAQQALEDCLRYEQFACDARDAGDVELAKFFDELSENDRDVAARAKDMLRTRLNDEHAGQPSPGSDAISS
jgi:rubrerythrin